jgi:S1-C subfamily serine protease
MKTWIGGAMIAAFALAAAPARAQDDKQELKKRILEEIAKKLDEESKRILEEISKLIDEEIAKFRGQKPPAAEAPAAPAGQPGFLGVRPDQEQPDEEDFKAWNVEGGVRIELAEGGPAAAAGLKDGDVVIEADGKKVREWAELPAALRKFKPGEKVKIKVLRGKETKEITVTLGKRPEEPKSEPAPPPAEAPKVEKTGRIGIKPGDATGKGMSIDSVAPDGPAANAGIQAGDVLAKLDATPIWKEADLEAFMKKTKPGQKVDVTVLRGGEEKKFSVVLGESR